MDSWQGAGRRPILATRWISFNSIEWILEVKRLRNPAHHSLTRALSIPLNGFFGITTFCSCPLGEKAFNSIEWIPLVYLYALAVRESLSIPLNGFKWVEGVEGAWAWQVPLSIPLNGFQARLPQRYCSTATAFQFHWMDSAPSRLMLCVEIFPFPFIWILFN